MNKTKLPYYEIFSLIIGEAVVGAAICAVFLIIKKFELNVLLGASLGAALTVLNFVALAIASTRAINRALEARGEGEMDDEAAAAFAKEHQAKLQLVMTVSYIVRILSLLGALIVAFILSEVFNPIATAIPLLLFRPILMISQMILKKRRSLNG